jgi:hypothetical protein
MCASHFVSAVYGVYVTIHPVVKFGTKNRYNEKKKGGIVYE